MTAGRARGALALLLALTVASPARADDAVAAEREYRQGFAALQQGNCTVALSHYQRSYALAPRPRTLFNMAACQEELGQALLAWRSYHAFLAQAEARDAAIVTRARARIEVLRAQLAGWVTVDAVPTGADVRVDDERAPRGRSPITLTLTPGEHMVHVAMAGAPAVDRPVVVEPETTTAVRVELGLPSAITIAVEPADATVQEVGHGPAVVGTFSANVAQGHHEFDIRRAGYAPEHIVVDAQVGRAYEHHVALRPARVATLRFMGAIAATVRVDGAVASGAVSASGALAMRDLTPGSHAIVVERPGFQPWQETLHLAAGEEVTVALALAPHVSAGARARTWTAIGLGAAGLAGGSVLGILAIRDVTSDDPDLHGRGKGRALAADALFTVGVVAIITAWRLSRHATSRATVARGDGGQ